MTEFKKIKHRYQSRWIKRSIVQYNMQANDYGTDYMLAVIIPNYLKNNGTHIAMLYDMRRLRPKPLKQGLFPTQLEAKAYCDNFADEYLSGKFVPEPEDDLIK